MPLSCIDLGRAGGRQAGPSGDGDPDGTPDFEREGDQEAFRVCLEPFYQVQMDRTLRTRGPGEVGLGYSIVAHEESPAKPKHWIQHQPRIHCISFKDLSVFLFHFVIAF